MPLVAERINKLTEAVAMLGFLFVDEADFDPHRRDRRGRARRRARGLRRAVGARRRGRRPTIEAALRQALVDGLGLKPRNAFGPVRVAVTGSRITPPLFESLELLGRDRSPGAAQAAAGMTSAGAARRGVRTSPPVCPTTASRRRAARAGGGRVVGVAADVASASLVVGLLVAELRSSLCTSRSPGPTQVAGHRLADLDHPHARRAWPTSTSPSRRSSRSRWLVQLALHGLPPRWLASVCPRVRWRFLLACLGVAVVALIADAGRQRAGAGPSTGDVSGHGQRVHLDDVRDYVLVILLLTPLQAAGEEYLFRGYLTQAFGGIASTGLGRRGGAGLPVRAGARARPERAGLLRPVRVRAVAGDPGDPHRRARGRHRDARAQQLPGVRRSRSPTATWPRTLNPTGGSWWTIPVTLTQSLVYLGLARPGGAAGWAWRPSTAARVLEAPARRV